MLDFSNLFALRASHPAVATMSVVEYTRLLAAERIDAAQDHTGAHAATFISMLVACMMGNNAGLVRHIFATAVSQVCKEVYCKFNIVQHLNPVSI